MSRGPWLPRAGILLLLAAQLQAHHSYTSEYEAATSVEVRGPIVKVEWTNPHSFIYLEGAVAGAAPATWKIEADSPSQLLKVNITREMLAVGSNVLVRGFPAKDGTPRIYGMAITFPNGATHKLEFQPEKKPFTLADWWRYTLPVLINEYFPFVLMALPFVVLFIGLYVLRSQRQKVRT